MRARALVSALLLALLASAPAIAQQQVVTLPSAVLTGNASSTITSGGTYQQIWPQSTNERGRTGCTVINNGTHTMYVYPGPIASATHASSVQLTAGQAFYCATGAGGVLRDQISIDGTTADAFYTAQQ